MKIARQMQQIGRISFMLFWIPFAMGFIGMIGMPNGSYDFVELPLLTRISIITGGTLIVASIVLRIGGMLLGGAANNSVLEHGRSAEARILKISDTGTTINNDPVVRFVLEVQPPGEPAFQAEAERLISRLHLPQIQPGNTVQVKYDAATQAVALVDEGDSL